MKGVVKDGFGGRGVFLVVVDLVLSRERDDGDVVIELKKI